MQKPIPQSKSVTFQIRFTKAERDRLQWLADHYAEGNSSAWLLYAMQAAPRRKIHVKKPL